MASQSPPAAGLSQFEVLYRAPGLSPIRMITILASAFCVGGLGFAYKLLEAPVIGPMAPVSGRVAAAVTAAMTVGGFIATWLYGRRIAARVALSPDGQVLRVAQPTPFGLDERDIALRDITCAGLQAGDSAGEKAMAASSLRVDVRGQRGFIVPLTGGGPGHDKLMRLLQVPANSGRS